MHLSIQQYRRCDWIVVVLLPVQDDILSFEEDKQAVYLQVYRPVYFQLVDVLLHKSHYPSQEEYGSWSPDDKEQFRIYRYERQRLLTLLRLIQNDL